MTGVQTCALPISYGEVGTLQGLLDLAGVNYVGSGVLSSAVCMDKEFMKRLLASKGLPIGRYVAIARGEWARDPQGVTKRVADLGFPVFVKPSRAGSSMGISKVHDADELAAAVEEAQRHDPKVIVEAMVRGREIEIGVLAGPDGAPAQTSPAAEIKVRGGHEFYDFEAKYLDGTTDIELPADLTPGPDGRVSAYAGQRRLDQRRPGVRASASAIRRSTSSA